MDHPFAITEVLFEIPFSNVHSESLSYFSVLSVPLYKGTTSGSRSQQKKIESHEIGTIAFLVRNSVNIRIVLCEALCYANPHPHVARNGLRISIYTRSSVTIREVARCRNMRGNG